jgi:hypothetical protein
MANQEVDPKSRFHGLWTYQYNNIMLSRDFVGLDLIKEMTKEEF